MVRKENNIILVSPRLFLLKDKQVAQTDSAQTKGKLKNRSVFPSAGKKTALFEPFIYKMHYFTKTGSGQT